MSLGKVNLLLALVLIIIICSIPVKAAEFANNTDPNFEQFIRDLLHMPNDVIVEPGNRNFYYQDALIPNPIANPSLEIMQQDNPNLPAYWYSNSWGENTASFFYFEEGHTGNRSVKVTISDYVDGDAKWFFTPIELTPGADYVFSNYYRANVESKVVLAVHTESDTIEYIGLPNAPAAADWREYRSAFTMPKHGVSITAYHLIAQNGYLMTDDYLIQPYNPIGFARGIVTLTFDDGWEDNTETALPVMQGFGYKSNQFYATTYIENPYVTDPKGLIQLFIDAGHEIGSHSVNHPDLTKLTPEQVIYELAESKRFLEDLLGIPARYFAAPYGAYNEDVIEKIMEHYQVHRTVDVGYNSRDNFDLARLKVQNVLSTTTPEEVAFWVQKAKKDRTWLILVYHRVANDPGIYDTTPELFEGHMQRIKAADVPVLTISEALLEITAQDIQIVNKIKEALNNNLDNYLQAKADGTTIRGIIHPGKESTSLQEAFSVSSVIGIILEIEGTYSFASISLNGKTYTREQLLNDHIFAIANEIKQELIELAGDANITKYEELTLQHLVDKTIKVVFAGTEFDIILKDFDECFIATAAYGSKLAPGVNILRQFRDAKLLTNLPGQSFVNFYYRVSPPVAEYIAGNSLLKILTRTLLLPVITAVYLFMHPWLILLFVLLVLVTIYYRRKVLCR